MGRTPLEEIAQEVNSERIGLCTDLMAKAAVLRTEAHGLLRTTQQAVVFTSERRLAIARRCLDRMEGILAELAPFASIARALRFEAESASQEALAHSGQDAPHLSARGYAADERSSTYILRNLGVVRQANIARHTHDQLQDTQRHLRGIASSLNGHRLEALTLLRANTQIATEEYDV